MFIRCDEPLVVRGPNWTEIRTSAWILRIKANTALSPGRYAGKSYFETLVTDTMAGLEGCTTFSHPDHASYLNTWNWERTSVRHELRHLTVHIISRGGREFVQISSPTTD